MNYSSSAPARSPIIYPADDGNSGMLDPSESPESRQKRIAAFRLLWERRTLLFRVAIIALLLSTLTAFLIPVRYESSAELMPPDQMQGAGMAMLSALTGSKGSGAGSSLGSLAGDLLGAKNTGALFVGVLQSRTVADRLIEQFQLRHVYRKSKIEDARDKLASRTDISEERKSGILKVTVTDHDAHRAADMARAYVTELDKLVAQVSTSSARRERIFLEGRLQAVKIELDAAAKKFSEFASKNIAIDVPAQGRAMVEAGALLQGQLIAAESELRGLEQIYTSTNVRVRALQARIGELRQQLQKLGGSDAPVEASNIDSIYPSIRKLPVLGVTYAELYRDTKIQETVFELLTQQYEMAKVQEAKEIPSVKVLDVPVVATKKSFPNRVLISCGGSILIIACAIGCIFSRKQWEEGDPNDPGRILALEMAASISSGVRRLAPVGTTRRSVLSGLGKMFRGSAHTPQSRPDADTGDAKESIKV